MSEQTEVSFDAALMMALRADAQKELDELPTPAQLKERYPDTSRWDARLQAALHKRRPVLKRVLVAALTLVILTLGALAVSADFRKAVYTMIQKFLPIEMQLTYQVDGEPLDTATIMCRMDLNEIVSRNLKELKTFCTFTRQKKAVRDIPFDAPLYSRGNSPHLTMSIQHIRM